MKTYIFILAAAGCGFLQAGCTKEQSLQEPQIQPTKLTERQITRAFQIFQERASQAFPTYPNLPSGGGQASLAGDAFAMDLYKSLSSLEGATGTLALSLETVAAQKNELVAAARGTGSLAEIEQRATACYLHTLIQKNGPADEISKSLATLAGYGYKDPLLMVQAARALEAHGRGAETRPVRARYTEMLRKGAFKLELPTAFAQKAQLDQRAQVLQNIERQAMEREVARNQQAKALLGA